MAERTRMGYTTRVRFRHPELDNGYFDTEAKSLEEAVRKCEKRTGVPAGNLYMAARIELPDWTGAVFQGHEG